MNIFWWLWGIGGYAGFMWCVIHNRTITDTEVHEEKHTSIFSSGYYCSHIYRDVKPSDVWIGLIWPLLFVKWFLICAMGLLNELLVFILIAFGFEYKETKMYRKLESWFLKN